MPDEIERIGTEGTPRESREVSREVHAEFYQAPIPPASEFGRYEAVLAGAADRILGMAERQAEHRQRLETYAVQGDFWKEIMGTVLAYIAFAAAMFAGTWLLAQDKSPEGLTALVTAVAIAFGPKVYRTLTDKRQKAEE